MALESAADFTSYVDTTAHGVTATLFEVQNSLFDSFGLIDSLFDIDSGNSTTVNIIIDQEYLGIGGGSIEVDGFQPTAFLKALVSYFPPVYILETTSKNFPSGIPLP